jgi:hypothetical protein
MMKILHPNVQVPEKAAAASLHIETSSTARTATA